MDQVQVALGWNRRSSTRTSTTKSEWLPDDPTAFVPTRLWKLPSITTWDASRNQNHPTDSAEEAVSSQCPKALLARSVPTLNRRTRAYGRAWRPNFQLAVIANLSLALNHRRSRFIPNVYIVLSYVSGQRLATTGYLLENYADRRSPEAKQPTCHAYPKFPHWLTVLEKTSLPVFSIRNFVSGLHSGSQIPNA